jgi:hypothetical protein
LATSPRKSQRGIEGEFVLRRIAVDSISPFMTSPDATSPLTGPWWFADEAFEPAREYAAQEALIRLEFSGAEISLAIATGCFYQAWLNGAWFGAGPARASHGRLTIDRWDLPAAAGGGRNVIVVQALWEGIFTFDHVRGEPGVWLALEGAGDLALSVSGKTGRLATHRISNQRGWVEEIDARGRAAGWPVGPWNESDWKPAVQRTKAEPVELEERDLLPFVRRERRARQVTFTGAADLAARLPHRVLGWEHAPGFGGPPDSPSLQIHEETLRPSAALDENLAGLTASGAGDTVLAPDPAGLDRTVQLDFGEFVSGALALAITAPAGTQIDVGWSESPWQPEQVSRWSESAQPGGSVPPREGNDSRQGSRYICAGGGERWDSLVVMALRCVRLSFRLPAGVREPVVIHELTLRVSGYPIAREGDFRCADDLLNRIYEAAVATLENSIFDVYMDCPGRERGGWLNDSYWASAGLAAISSDTSLDRRFLRQFIDSLAHNDHGTVFPLYPSECIKWLCRPQLPIVTHTLFWLLHVERHLRLHGGEDLRAAWRPGVQAVFDGLRKYRNAEGMLEDVPWDDFIDWSPVESGPLRPWTNFVYGLALKRLGALDQNEAWRRDGEETLATAERLGWNEGRALYADTLRREGDKIVPGERFSEMSNYVALWSGAVPREREEIVWRQLRNLHPGSTDRALMPEDMGLTRGNAYSLLYRFELLGRRGEIADLIRDLREAFLPMFERGQTTFSEHLGYHHSLCHGFQGNVAHVIARHVAGIQLPELPGEVIRLRPNPALLAWSQARVPWMGGHVQLWCARRGEHEAEVLISLPPGQRGELMVGSQTPISFEGTLQTHVAF